MQNLKTWWDDTGEPNKDGDRKPVGDARIFGGQMALKLTAAVPATMFVGYLLLVLYFKSQGGYTTVDITGEESSPAGGSDEPSAGNGESSGDEAGDDGGGGGE